MSPGLKLHQSSHLLGGLNKRPMLSCGSGLEVGLGLGLALRLGIGIGLDPRKLQALNPQQCSGLTSGLS